MLAACWWASASKDAAVHLPKARRREHTASTTQRTRRKERPCGSTGSQGEGQGTAGDSRVQTHTWRWIRGAAEASSEQTLSTYLWGTVAALWRQACRMAAAGTARNKMLTKTGRGRLPRGGGWPAKARYARPVEVGAAQEA